MKIRIDKWGELHKERAGREKAQWCPLWSESDNMKQCGDWCPLFNEPVVAGPDTLGSLDLCRTVLYGEITDERGGA